ncbi:MAG: biotin transporter BioY [Oscillospiraceae bacterium]|nr:biotin transporter BioY [Oscillospiraceae bacterium]
MEKRKSRNYNMLVCALFAAICCVLSPIAIPIGPVPISLGLFAIIFTGVVLGPLKGAISVLVFFLIGLFFPVFTGGQVGFSAFVGPTGGYAWSYLLVVVVVGFLTKIPIKNKVLEIIATIFFCMAGIATCYFFGTLQFMVVMNTNLTAAISACVIPFIPFDFGKCVVAGVMGPMLKVALKKAKLI